MRVSCTALCLGVSIMLAACGGGDGDGGTPATTLVSVPLNASNYAPTGRAAAATLVDAASSSSVSTLADAGPAPVAIFGAGLPRLFEYVGKRAAAGLSSRDHPAASVTESADCPLGGSIVLTIDDRNNNEVLDGGDTASINFQACTAGTDIPTVNGGLDLAFHSVTLDAWGDVTGFSATITARQLASGGSMVDGPADYVLSPTKLTVNYRNAVSTRQGVATVYNFLATFDTSSASETLTIAGEIGIGGASYALSTPAPVVMGSFYPKSGLLRVADAAGGRVDVVLGLAGFDLELYLAGDDVRDATVSHTWAALAAGSI